MMRTNVWPIATTRSGSIAARRCPRQVSDARISGTIGAMIREVGNRQQEHEILG